MAVLLGDLWIDGVQTALAVDPVTGRQRQIQQSQCVDRVGGSVSNSDGNPTKGMAFRSGYGDLAPVNGRRFRGGVHLSDSASLLEVRDIEDGTWYELSIPAVAVDVVNDGTGWFVAVSAANYILANVTSGEVQIGATPIEGFSATTLISAAELADMGDSGAMP